MRALVQSKKEPFRIIDASEVPQIRQTRTEEWIERLRSISPGKALVGTTAELGAWESVYKIIKGYERKKLIPKGYRVAQRKKGETTFIYIINETKSREVETPRQATS